MHLKLFPYNLILITGLFLIVPISAQDKYVQLDSLLSNKAAEIPALNEKVSISVSDVPLEEFLRGVANSSGLNLDVQPGLQYQVVNNFTNVLVRDVLVFTCRQFQLDLEISGNIISLVKKSSADLSVSGSVKWDDANKLVTFDFSNIPIEQAGREITLKTKANVILSPNIADKMINGYIESQPLKNALEKLAYSNGLSLKQTDDNFFILEQEINPLEQNPNFQNDRTNRKQGNQSRSSGGEYTLKIDFNSKDNFDILAENAPIPAILNELSEKAGMNYIMSPNIEDVVTMQVKGSDINGMLNNLFGGTKIGFRKSENIYLIGEKENMDFKEHRVIQLQNRSIDKLVEKLPEDFTKNIAIKEFPELNSLFVTGAAYQVDEFEKFIKSIDKVVPVILIEVIILYINKSITISTGISAGLADQPVKSSGTLLPGIDLKIGSKELNNILDNLGWVNLGKVSPNFYISLQALETQGFLDLKSTPKLSTLNGNEATMSIGNTEYYLEEQTNLYGTLNPQQSTSTIYKAVNAELSVKIKPVVSADDQITLDISVLQSDFTERISATAPPGTVNREFTSKIRVKNQDMILLGGLMENRKSDNGRGIPFLSRIPVIKWFFSSRKKEKSESKLSILIRPTIIN
jgi:type IV pilus assembly protein PilQ